MSARPFVFLGLDETTGEERGLHLEKNLLTFAGAGSGKGACHIIPNLRRWPHNAVVIDPKGEAAELTAEHRAEHIGQTVAVIDPYTYAAKLDPAFRAAFNPLDLVDTSDDLWMIAQGIIKRSAQESQPHWNNSAEAVAAGIMAFILESPHFENCHHLGKFREVLSLLQRKDEQTLHDMQDCEGFSQLAAQAADRLSSGTSEVSNILSTLDTQTKFLTSEPICEALSQTGFLEGGPLDLRDMKEGKLSLFLVLPPKMLGQQGQFLRLFVNMLLSVMQDKTTAGDQLGERCLFILDEFYSLGRLQEIVTASGQLRSSGVHLWPFVQSIGQLTELYGKEGLEAFTEDADALSIFGVRGTEVCEYASRRVGMFKSEDIRRETLRITEAERRGYLRALYPRFLGLSGRIFDDQPNGKPENRRQFIRQEADAFLRAKVGKPYYYPDQIREQVRKHENEDVPQRLLMLDGSGHAFLRPQPWFAPTWKPAPEPTKKDKLRSNLNELLLDTGVKLPLKPHDPTAPPSAITTKISTTRAELAALGRFRAPATPQAEPKAPRTPRPRKRLGLDMPFQLKPRDPAAPPSAMATKISTTHAELAALGRWRNPPQRSKPKAPHPPRPLWRAVVLFFAVWMVLGGAALFFMAGNTSADTMAFAAFIAAPLLSFVMVSLKRTRGHMPRIGCASMPNHSCQPQDSGT